MKKIPYLFFILIIIISCDNNRIDYDAAGAFEAKEIIVSSQGNGQIISFNVNEGQALKSGEIVGHIDTLQLTLKKNQLDAMKTAVDSRHPDISSQLAVYQAQLKQATHEQQRLERLVNAEAATQKQLDDANAQVNILKKQIAAQKRALETQSRSINKEGVPLSVQIDQIDEQINNHIIKNPINGIVLEKYAEKSEITGAGKPLYKIADLSNMKLRAYVVGSQLSSLKVGQKVTVKIDAGEDDTKSYDGTVEWISNKAEFTPKTIQTKDERENLVYAIKVSVKNDGFIKIGMYGEVYF